MTPYKRDGNFIVFYYDYNTLTLLVDDLRDEYGVDELTKEILDEVYEKNVPEVEIKIERDWESDER